MIMGIKCIPIKYIILEMMLVGNVAMLSNRSLEQLAFLSVKHDLNLSLMK